jgi:hypothetical protein
MLTQDCTPYLCEEHNTRWYFEILPHLEVTSKVNGSTNDIMTPHRKLLVNIQELLSRNII